MGEENKDIYICFTQNKDVALIISEKDTKWGGLADTFRF